MGNIHVEHPAFAEKGINKWKTKKQFNRFYRNMVRRFVLFDVLEKNCQRMEIVRLPP
jgi:hypothetical protein